MAHLVLQQHGVEEITILSDRDTWFEFGFLPPGNNHILKMFRHMRWPVCHIPDTIERRSETRAATLTALSGMEGCI